MEFFKVLFQKLPSTFLNIWPNHFQHVDVKFRFQEQRYTHLAKNVTSDSRCCHLLAVSQPIYQEQVRLLRQQKILTTQSTTVTAKFKILFVTT